MPYRDINVGDKVTIVGSDNVVMYAKIKLAPFEVNGVYKVMIENSELFYDADSLHILEDHGDHASGPPRQGSHIPDRNLMNNG